MKTAGWSIVLAGAALAWVACKNPLGTSTVKYESDWAGDASGTWVMMYDAKDVGLYRFAAGNGLKQGDNGAFNAATFTVDGQASRAYSGTNPQGQVVMFTVSEYTPREGMRVQVRAQSGTGKTYTFAGTATKAASGWQVKPDGGSAPGGNAPNSVPPSTGPGTVDCGQSLTWECQEGDACKRLRAMDRESGKGYLNRPKNGETEANMYRSYLRGDTIALIKYAAASTLCVGAKAGDGAVGPLELGDMSEANGATPGTSVGSPGHPASTHQNGTDIDIAYYQKGANGNVLGPVCEHATNGVEQDHCTADPTQLDMTRNAIFIAKLHDNPKLRVIGVDGRIGEPLKAEIRRLCAAGTLANGACKGMKVTYETTDGGKGWFRFHHTHFHVSVNPDQESAPFALVGAEDVSRQCITVDCRTLMGPADGPHKPTGFLP